MKKCAPLRAAGKESNGRLGSDKKKMKCLTCGHQFTGELYDSCPECLSSDIEEVIDEKDGGYW